MKFSIRDLLFVTVIVGLGVAWWLDHSRLTTTNQMLQTEIRLWNSNAKHVTDFFRFYDWHVTWEGGGVTFQSKADYLARQRQIFRSTAAKPAPKPAQ